MTDKAISPLRQRLIEDMTIRRLGPRTQHDYIRHVKSFADFLGRSADKATAEDVHRYQLWLASIGTTAPIVNVSATALRFFFRVTLRRHDLAEEVIWTREPRRLPVVLSPEEVGGSPRRQTSSTRRSWAWLSHRPASLGGRIAQAHRYRS
jgi:integrase/recombinase XerD